MVEVSEPRRKEVELEGQEEEVERELEVEEEDCRPHCLRPAAAAGLGQSARPSGSLCR